MSIILAKLKYKTHQNLLLVQRGIITDVQTDITGLSYSQAHCIMRFQMLLLWILHPEQVIKQVTQHILLNIVGFDGGVGTAQSVQWLITGWMARVRFLAVHDFFLFFTASRPNLGPTRPLSDGYQPALSLGVKWQGHEADHSPPSNAKIRNGEAMPPLPHMSSQHNA
jgi:hypothetical protein